VKESGVRSQKKKVRRQESGVRMKNADEMDRSAVFTLPPLATGTVLETRPLILTPVS
jgi:hypothetical protein